jgi:hypothetical protein
MRDWTPRQNIAFIIVVCFSAWGAVALIAWGLVR